MRILVTGGAGFIGSALIRFLIRNTTSSVVNIDKLTYAAAPEALQEMAGTARYDFEQNDICDGGRLEKAFTQFAPDAVMHLAAESHVDRSIDAPADFIQTNILGTYTLLEVARRYWEGLSPAGRSRFRLLHVSTDEVFGSLKDDEPGFSESTPYRPNSAYSASKASADHLARAWHKTFGLPVIVSNCSNNYGAWQFPEKLIPLTIINGLLGKPMPIYGTGENIRDWLFVDDHAKALWTVLTHGQVGSSYNVGGRAERRNIDVVRTICQVLDRLAPSATIGHHEQLMSFVPDRPGHDYRYAIDCGRIEQQLGWTPRISFEAGIEKTVAWYLEHRGWWEAIRVKTYEGQRLGLRLAAQT
jgi:dTDP-glucose 4,6-dehydratase